MVSNLLADCSDILATHLYRKQALKIHFKQMGIIVYTTAHIQDPNQMKRRAKATPPMGVHQPLQTMSHWPPAGVVLMVSSACVSNLKLLSYG